MRKRNEDFSLKELINIFLPKLWIIAIVAMLFGGIMMGYSKFIKDDTYTSTTKIHVIKASSLDFAVSDVEFASSYLETYIEVLTIPDFLNEVVADFKSNHASYEKYEGEYEEKGWDKLTGGSIRGYISAGTIQDILSISVTTGDPYLSCGIATSIANVFDKGDTLAYPDDVVFTKTVQVATPNAANSRNVVLNTIIGALVGVIVSMIAIFLFNMFDVIIHDKKKIEDSFDIPVIGVIPRFMTEEGRSKK